MFAAAVIYLCVPLFLFLFTFLNLWHVLFAALLTTVLVCCVYHTHKQEHSPWPQPLFRYGPPLLIAALLVYGGIWSPFNYWDWQKHFAVLNLLIEHDWPPRVELGGQEYFLRYGLGWYLVPALLAKLFGFIALTPAMFLWTLLGTGLALLLSFRELHKWWHLLLATLIYFFFSGLDLVGAWFMKNISSPLSPHWLQWWVGWGQLSPNIFGTTWVPQHALPAWLGVGLVLGARRLSVHYGAVILAAIALWSPFAAIGLTPLYLWALSKEGLRTALTLPNSCGLLLLAPLLLYFGSDAGQIPITAAMARASVLSLVLFVALEFGVATAILLCCRGTDRGLLLVSFTTLCLLVSFRLGTLNDLLMRGSIAAITVMAVLSSRALLHATLTPRVVVIKVVLSIYLIAAAIPAVVSFVVGVNPRQSRISKHHRITPDSVLVRAPQWRIQYLARAEERTLLYLRE